MRKMLFAAVLAAAATVGVAFAGDIKSGPQTGDTVPGPFHPLNVNGESAGKKACLYCKNGDNPVAVVFARSADCPQTVKLLKKLEELTAKNEKAEMGSYAVYLSDDDKLADKLASVAKKEGLKHLVLSVDNPAGPEKYKIAKDADVTVLLYTERKVKANYSFKKGEIKDGDIDAIAKDVSKIVPAK
ncbi:MAG: hypothetical protein JNK93_04290 [Planctomycetia bacterium]|nr:hypothetical protein [Planctomycetia bacterium]